MLSSMLNTQTASPEELVPRHHGLAPGAAALPTSLQDHNVLLRPFQLADAEPMYEAARESIAELCTWMTWCQPEYSKSDAEAFVSQSARSWEQGEHYSFAILDAQNSRFLGSIGLNNLNATHKLGNVGYWVRSSAAGCGRGTAATRLLAAYALQELGLNRLEFLIPLANVASQRVARKARARLEGILRSRLMIAGVTHDAALYSLLKEGV